MIQTFLYCENFPNIMIAEIPKRIDDVVIAILNHVPETPFTKFEITCFNPDHSEGAPLLLRINLDDVIFMNQREYHIHYKWHSNDCYIKDTKDPRYMNASVIVLELQKDDCKTWLTKIKLKNPFDSMGEEAVQGYRELEKIFENLMALPDPRPKILVAEDETYVWRGVKKLLERDYDLTFVRSGEEALEELECNKYDLLLTDFVMEKMNGSELVRAIRENSRFNSYRDMPIIVISKDLEPYEKETLLDVGATAVLDKQRDFPYLGEKDLKDLCVKIGLALR